jgi:hypothetical protein
MTTYTVIGVYADNDQRFATTVDASSPQEAERHARNEAGSKLLIAGVLEGTPRLVDVEYANDEGDARELDLEADTVFPYHQLAALGVKAVEIEYSGSNDEGYVNDITATTGELSPAQKLITMLLPRDLEESLRESAYDVLGRYFGGWEINEGSSGVITLNVPARDAVIHHGEIVEHQNWHDVTIN